MKEIERFDLLEDFRDLPLDEEWTAILTLTELFEFIALNACYLAWVCLIEIPWYGLKWLWRNR